MGVTAGYRQSAEHVAKRIAGRLSTLASKPKMVSAGWLRAHYVLLGMDCVQIGAITQRDPKTIWSWLRFYGIPTRPRGGNHTQLPKGRAPGFRLSEEQKDGLRRARAADGRIPCVTDGVHWLHKAGAIHPNWKGGITPERQAFYLTAEWKEAVKAVWARADARCERCDTHHNTAKSRGTFHVHHIVSFMVRELRAAVPNLALLCKPCHLFVHSGANVGREFLKEEEK